MSANVIHSPAYWSKKSKQCWIHVKEVTRAQRCAYAEHQTLFSRESFKARLMKPLCKMGSKSDGAVTRKEENAACMRTGLKVAAHARRRKEGATGPRCRSPAWSKTHGVRHLNVEGTQSRLPRWARRKMKHVYSHYNEIAYKCA